MTIIIFWWTILLNIIKVSFRSVPAVIITDYEYLPVEAVVKPLSRPEADDGVNDDGSVNRREAIYYRDDDGVLLTVITAEIEGNMFCLY